MPICMGLFLGCYMLHVHFTAQKVYCVQWERGEAEGASEGAGIEWAKKSEGAGMEQAKKGE